MEKVVYEVGYRGTIIPFTSLADARKFYESLPGNKFIQPSNDRW